VEAVKAAIEAKKQEINDSDSIFSQFTDYVEGVYNTIKDLPGEGASEMPKSMSGIEGWAAGGTGPMVGYGMFVYASYRTMNSMADAANNRRSDLRTLQEQALPAAQAQVEVRKREVKIANLQQQIAQADADLATNLASAMRAFQAERFLSTEFWSKLLT